MASEAAKMASKAAEKASETARSQLVERWRQLEGPSDPPWRATEPAVRASKPVGRPLEHTGRPTEPAGKPWDPVGRPSQALGRGDAAKKDDKFVGQLSHVNPRFIIQPLVFFSAVGFYSVSLNLNETD